MIWNKLYSDDKLMSYTMEMYMYVDDIKLKLDISMEQNVKFSLYLMELVRCNFIFYNITLYYLLKHVVKTSILWQL